MDPFTTSFVKRCFKEGLNEAETTRMLLQDAMEKVAAGREVESDIARKFLHETARQHTPFLQP